MTVVAVTLFTRWGCHLCEQAETALARLGDEFQLDLTTVDVDELPTVRERYGSLVPVVAVDGREVSTVPLDWSSIRRAISNAA